MNAPDAEARASIDALIQTFFAAFDNRGGNAPSRESFNGLFARHAVVASHGAAGLVICGADEFLSPRIELLGSGRLLDFHEWESESHTDLFGTLAVRRSRYAKSGMLEGKPYGGSGTKYFQLARTAEGWRVVALSWIDDAAS